MLPWLVAMEMRCISAVYLRSAIISLQPSFVKRPKTSASHKMLWMNFKMVDRKPHFLSEQSLFLSTRSFHDGINIKRLIMDIQVSHIEMGVIATQAQTVLGT